MPGDWQWEQLARRFKENCRRRDAMCHLCLARGDVEMAFIDYDAKPLFPWAFETDHILPRSTHPHLRYMWSNLAPSHSRCNRQRRDEMLARIDGTKDVVAHQLPWVKPDW